mmetsp:Transcript_76910/g.152232  ORF Transcript_76910/g.152232 Transcript_76910/m.152232 type:complete len:308 (-) Transcript_76910:348-1271(-)
MPPHTRSWTPPRGNDTMALCLSKLMTVNPRMTSHCLKSPSTTTLCNCDKESTSSVTSRGPLCRLPTTVAMRCCSGSVPPDADEWPRIGSELRVWHSESISLPSCCSSSCGGAAPRSNIDGFKGQALSTVSSICTSTSKGLPPSWRLMPSCIVDSWSTELSSAGIWVKIRGSKCPSWSQKLLSSVGGHGKLQEQEPHRRAANVKAMPTSAAMKAARNNFHQLLRPTGPLAACWVASGTQLPPWPPTTRHTRSVVTTTSASAAGREITGRLLVIRSHSTFGRVSETPPPVAARSSDLLALSSVIQTKDS